MFLAPSRSSRDSTFSLSSLFCLSIDLECLWLVKVTEGCATADEWQGGVDDDSSSFRLAVVVPHALRASGRVGLLQSFIAASALSSSVQRSRVLPDGLVRRSNPEPCDHMALKLKRRGCILQPEGRTYVHKKQAKKTKERCERSDAQCLKAEDATDDHVRVSTNIYSHVQRSRKKAFPLTVRTSLIGRYSPHNQ